jgi:hypothetical protein
MHHLFRLRSLCLLLLLSNLVGCRHIVYYKTTPETAREGRKIVRQWPGNLRIMKFTDQAPKHPSVSLVVDGKTWKTNTMDVYKGKEYAGAIAHMMAKDLASTGMFPHVLGPDDRGLDTDYVLMGTIWDFSAVGLWHKGPESAVIFSSVLANLPGALISAAATSKITTEIVTSVILTDIRMLNLKTGKVMWTCPILRAGGKETVSWSKADPDKLASRADDRLREVVTQLIERMQREASSAP